MKPAYSDDWATVYSVDALTGLQQLLEKSVHCAITSPPYWGLRSYLASDHPDKAMELGAEPTPELYVERLVEVFRALRRVLRDDGTLWLNLGDSYAAGKSGRSDADRGQRHTDGRNPTTQTLWQAPPPVQRQAPPGYKPKDLVGIPWLTAFALRADGWYLRSDIVWSKPNPMPESVTDRPTKSHEYIFLLTKSPRYYFDQDAVREPHWHQRPENQERYAAQIEQEKHRRENQAEPLRGSGQTAAVKHSGEYKNNRLSESSSGRNIRSVWDIATQPYPGAHYATFPPALIYPCIRAGTSERGVCEACGAPWERVVERQSPPYYQGGKAADLRATGAANHRTACGPTGNGLNVQGSQTVGWQPTCSCNVDTVPATVLDPFMGSGTTALAARKLGRRSIGFDLDERNIKQTEERLGYQGVLL